MNSTTRISSILTAAALIGLLLVGCTPAPLDLDIPVVIPTELTEQPTPDETDEPTDVPVEELTAGDTLTEEDALALNRDFRAGKRAYQLADGTYVVTTPDAPLPAEVKNEITAGVGSAAQGAAIGNTSDVRSELADAAYDTGRKFIGVTPVQSSCSDGGFGPVVWTYGVVTDVGYVVACVSKDDAIARANAIIAGKDDPSQWEIIVS